MCPSPDKLACYFGLVPRVRQSAARCYHGGITKAGRSHARFVAVEAAQVVAMSQVPLTATYYRVRRKRGHNVAVAALARKLVVLAWHMLTKREPYRHAPLARTRKKLLRLTDGMPANRARGVADDLESVYSDAALPALRPPTPGEKRAAARNRRAITVLKKQLQPRYSTARTDFEKIPECSVQVLRTT